MCFNFCQVVLLIHFADATGHTAVVGQRVFQHKASHTGLAAIYQILMDGTETFLAIVVIGIDHDERCAKNILCCKHGLPGSPRFCTALQQ